MAGQVPSTAHGATEVVEVLGEAGVGHLFGLPGSSMVSLLNTLSRTEIDYVPAVHESVAVAMADGYARVRGLGCALVYMMPGLANSVGNLYNAWRDESPVLLLASQQMASARFGQATVGEADLAGLVAPFTRFADEVPAGAPLRPRITAALRAAQGPPAGPAFLALPEDVLEGWAPRISERRSTRVAAAALDVRAVVRALAAAERPLLVVGGQLQRCGGAAALAKLAEDYAIPVALESGWNDRLAIGPGHPNYIGRLVDPPARAVESESDVVVSIGARHLLEAHPRSAPWFAGANFVAHVNADAAKLEYPHTADWASAADPAAFVEAVGESLASEPRDSELLMRRASRLAEIREAMATIPRNGYTPGVRALSDALDHGWVVDESVTGSGNLLRALTSRDGTRYLSTTGASLGWGIGASCGVALASDEPVTCVLGDGSLLFGVQGLWTAVARSLPIVFVVFDNGGYGSTRFFERDYIQRAGITDPPAYLGSDFRSLGPNPADVLTGFGVPTRTVETGDDPRTAVLAAREASAKGPAGVVINVDF